MTCINWEAVAGVRERVFGVYFNVSIGLVGGVRDSNGKASAAQLNENLDRWLGSNRGINSSRFGDSFRGMEELYAGQEDRNEEVNQQQQQCNQRGKQHNQRRAEQIQAAKGLVDELITFVMEDHCRW